MAYLRNTWYPAAWTEEVTATPLARILLDEPLVFYRTEAGKAVALSDTCPHRFAPLSKGKVVGDHLACPYHGLTFGPDGTCVHNPHGAIPSNAHITGYPLEERYGLLWIWLGDKAPDQAALPSFPELEAPGWGWVHDRLHVGGNYQLVADNLLDLSHVEFVHPMFSLPGNAARTTYDTQVEGDIVTSIYEMANEPRSPTIGFVWPGAPDHIRMQVKMRWQAPSILFQDQKATFVGGDLDNPPLRLPMGHFLAPETATSTHYFWITGRNHNLDNGQIDQMTKGAVNQAFMHEDEPLIAAVQARMSLLGEDTLKPLLFKTDTGAVQARRALARQIEVEKSI